MSEGNFTFQIQSVASQSQMKHSQWTREEDATLLKISRIGCSWEISVLPSLTGVKERSRCTNLQSTRVAITRSEALGTGPSKVTSTDAATSHDTVARSDDDSGLSYCCCDPSTEDDGYSNEDEQSRSSRKIIPWTS